MSDTGEQNGAQPAQQNPSSKSDEQQAQSGDASQSQSSSNTPPVTSDVNNQLVSTDNAQQQRNTEQQSNTVPPTQHQNDADKPSNTVPVCNGRVEQVTPSVESPQPVGSESLNEDVIALVNTKTDAFPEAFPPAATNPNNGMTMKISASDMEVMQLKVKVICQEKNILALKMELKSSELQLEAKNKIDEKKTRLVELLDNKLTAMEKRNAKLMDMLEQMLKDKEANTNRLKDATKNMQDLSQRLSDSERIKSELLRVNAELKKMLENLETKGSQIAKLAKEKVLKYRNENDAMQLELNSLKEAVPEAAGQEPAIPITKVEIDSSACDELWCKIKEIQDQISTTLKSIDGSQVEGLRDTVQGASEANEALKVSVEEARVKTGEDLSALSVENDQLRSLIDDFDVTRKKMEKTEEKNRDLLEEQKNYITAKDKEIIELKEELQRLKGAIGQLIGAK